MLTRLTLSTRPQFIQGQFSKQQFQITRALASVDKWNINFRGLTDKTKVNLNFNTWYPYIDRFSEPLTLPNIPHNHTRCVERMAERFSIKE